MAASSRRAGASKLRDAIQTYLSEQQKALDQWAREMLAWLADRADAAKAFERLKLRDGRAPHIISLPRSHYDGQRKAAEILTICIQA